MNAPGIKEQVKLHSKRLQEEIAKPLELVQWTPALCDHVLTVAVPVSRPVASLKVMVLPLTVLVPVIFPDESR
jgi:hypothetical protein